MFTRISTLIFILVFAFLFAPPGWSQEAPGPLLKQAGEHMANWRWADAEQAYEKALQVAPNNAAVLSQNALFKRFMGEYAESVRLQRRAVELDPKTATQHFQLGISYRYARDYQAATAAFRTAIGLDPDIGNPHAILAITAISRGDELQAVRHLQIAERLFGEEIPDWRTAQLAYAYAQLGRRQDVQRLVTRLEQRRTQVSNVAWAVAYVALGDYAQALQRLEMVVKQQERTAGVRQLLGEIAANTYDDPALDGPRFQEVLRRVWDGSARGTR